VLACMELVTENSDVSGASSSSSGSSEPLLFVKELILPASDPAPERLTSAERVAFADSPQVRRSQDPDEPEMARNR
jgi:hypothetical protein